MQEKVCCQRNNPHLQLPSNLDLLIACENASSVVLFRSLGTPSGVTPSFRKDMGASPDDCIIRHTNWITMLNPLSKHITQSSWRDCYHRWLLPTWRGIDPACSWLTPLIPPKATCVVPTISCCGTEPTLCVTPVLVSPTICDPWRDMIGEDWQLEGDLPAACRALEGKCWWLITPICCRPPSCWP